MKELPHLSVLTMTFGRVDHLNEALDCFLRQDYPGPKEMLIYNSWPRQRLHGTFPNVRIINSVTRASSLGACRNEAIAHLRDDTLVCILDDDDLIRNHHLSTFADNLRPEDDWLWQSHQYFLEGWKMRKIVSGTPNTLAFRRSAWKEVGGYPPLDVGEDRVLLQKIMTRPGRKIQLKPTEVSFCYAWSNSAYHVSGMGDDVPGRPSGHDRIGAYTEAQANAGFIPTGDIELKPERLHDYEQMAKDFITLSTRHEDVKKNSLPVPQPGDAPPYAPPLDALKPFPSVTLVYIYVPGDPEHEILAGRFLSTYTKCPPGIPHNTVIVCQGKAADSPAIKLYRSLPNVSFFQHDDSGYDIGAFLAVSRTLDCDFAVYCGGKTSFKRGGWLARMAEAWKMHGPGFYGTLSSYEVSPHLNTSGFFCSPKMMARYPYPVATTAERYNFEHGPKAMWRFCLRAGLPAKLVTWCGAYDWPEWRVPPAIYRRGDQSNCLTYFKHTGLFEEADPQARDYMTGLADTITDIYFLKCRLRNNFSLEPYGTTDDESWRKAMVNMENAALAGWQSDEKDKRKSEMQLAFERARGR